MTDQPRHDDTPPPPPASGGITPPPAPPRPVMADLDDDLDLDAPVLPPSDAPVHTASEDADAFEDGSVDEVPLDALRPPPPPPVPRPDPTAVEAPDDADEDGAAGETLVAPLDDPPAVSPDGVRPQGVRGSDDVQEPLIDEDGSDDAASPPEKRGRGRGLMIGCGVVALLGLLLGGAGVLGVGALVVGAGAWYAMDDLAGPDFALSDEADRAARLAEAAAAEAAAAEVDADASDSALDGVDDGTADLDEADAELTEEDATDPSAEDAPDGSGTAASGGEDTEASRALEELLAPAPSRAPRATDRRSTPASDDASPSASRPAAAVSTDDGTAEADATPASARETVTEPTPGGAVDPVRSPSSAADPDKASVSFQGASQVRLIGGASGYTLPAVVEPGRYDLEVTFEGQEPVVVGKVRAKKGETVFIRCNSAMGLCRTQ